MQNCTFSITACTALKQIFAYTRSVPDKRKKGLNLELGFFYQPSFKDVGVFEVKVNQLIGDLEYKGSLKTLQSNIRLTHHSPHWLVILLDLQSPPFPDFLLERVL